METKTTLNKPVFFISSAIVAFLVLYASILPKQANTFFKQLQATIVENGSWFYILAVADHSTTDYKNLTWFAMLFSAGMGIGLMFFGVAEPIMHFLSPPVGDGNTVETAREAMKITFFHWGLHAWAIYAIVAIILAFFAYRHNLPLTLRSSLYPIIGDKIYGSIGNAVDIFAVIGTLFGVATSLGYGVLQINTGLNYLWGVEISTTVQVILILGVTALATLSVTTGLDKGIKILSQINLSLAVVLMIFVLICGSTVFLLQTYVQNIGSYASNLFSNTFNLFAYEKTDWIGGWTILYWAWWISWSPFVGLFIARISRGRTIREFILGVLLIPTGFTLMWMTVFGNSAIDIVLFQGVEELGKIVSKDVSVALYAFLEYFPFASLTSVIATVMIVVFFVTSADSGSMVIDMLCSNGNDKTPIWQRVYWSVGEGVVASVLMLAGGLGAVQTMAIASALPFTIVLLIAIYGLLKALKLDIAKKESLLYNATPTVTPSSASGNWQERLENIVDYPTKNNVQKFLAKKVKPAMEDVANELKKHDLDIELIQSEDLNELKLSVKIGEKSNFGENKNFVYQVKNTPKEKPTFIQDEENTNEEELYYSAVVYLIEGGQDYDLMGWSKEGIRNDIIDQYQKHMHFIHSLS